MEHDKDRTLTNIEKAMMLTEGVQDEYATIEKYLHIKKCVNDPEVSRELDEIIADEKEHTERFQRLVEKFDKIEPSED